MKLVMQVAIGMLVCGASEIISDTHISGWLACGIFIWLMEHCDEQERRRMPQPTIKRQGREGE